MTDYGYYHARIRGMKSDLLDTRFLESLLDCREISELGKLLDETVYKEDIHRGRLCYSGASGIEEGLRLNLISTFQRILGLLEGEAKSNIQILLEQWDIQNIKTILRGKHIGAGSDEIISSFVPAGCLTEATLASLARQPDIKAAIDLMATWRIHFYKPLTKSFSSSYVATQSLAPMELSLDKYYYKRSLSQLSERSLESAFVRQLVRRQIDFSNIMTVLRLVHEHTLGVAGENFIDGGKEIDSNQFHAMASLEQIEEVVEALRGTSYHEQLVGGLEDYRSFKSLAAIERSLEELRTKKLVGLFKADPLSLAVIIAYLWAKVNEVINIRIVLRAKEAGMPDIAIRQALVLI